MKKVILIVVLILGIALIAGCGGDKTINTDKGSVSVNEEKNKVEVKNDDGSSAQLNVSNNGDSVALPDDYPKDIVPIMDGARITAANRFEDATKKAGFQVVFFSDKDPKEVKNFYDDTLKDLTDSNKMDLNGTYSIGGKKSGHNIGVVITTEENEGQKQTMVNVTVGPVEQ